MVGLCPVTDWMSLANVDAAIWTPAQSSAETIIGEAFPLFTNGKPLLDEVAQSTALRAFTRKIWFKSANVAHSKRDFVNAMLAVKWASSATSTVEPLL